MKDRGKEKEKKTETEKDLNTEREIDRTKGEIGTCGGTSVHCRFSLRGRIERERERKNEREK